MVKRTDGVTTAQENVVRQLREAYNKEGQGTEYYTSEEVAAISLGYVDEVMEIPRGVLEDTLSQIKTNMCAAPSIFSAQPIHAAPQQHLRLSPKLGEGDK